MKTYPRLHEVEPLNEKDKVIFNEIRAVLEKYDALDRFGVNLLHSHFDIAEDEILKEHCDEENRVLTMRVEKRSSIPSTNAVHTSWEMRNFTALVGCINSIDVLGEVAIEEGVN